MEKVRTTGELLETFSTVLSMVRSFSIKEDSSRDVCNVSNDLDAICEVAETALTPQKTAQISQENGTRYHKKTTQIPQRKPLESQRTTETSQNGTALSSFKNLP